MMANGCKSIPPHCMPGSTDTWPVWTPARTAEQVHEVDKRRRMLIDSKSTELQRNRCGWVSRRLSFYYPSTANIGSEYDFSVRLPHCGVSRWATGTCSSAHRPLTRPAEALSNRQPRQTVHATSQSRGRYGNACSQSCRVIQTHSSFQAIEVGTCLSRSTVERSTKLAMLWESLGLYGTGYGTPRRRWRSARALMSRSCRGF